MEPDVASSVIKVRVPGTAVPFELVRTPVGAVEFEDAEHQIGSLFVLRTELTWDLYDIYVYELDEPDGSSPADAVSRPSKPYVPPDRGFGHDGYPAIGMTRGAAEGFCEWLSLKTGLSVRLPTQPEWVYLARAGDLTPYCCGVTADTLGEVAWFLENSEHTTHPVGLKKPNGFGLFDIHGNAAEWVMTDTRRPIAMGGGYRDAAEASTTTSAQRQMSNWNQSDPQIPKSRWWLADCSWVGFRFVVDATDEQTRKLEELRDE
ncbi:MAG: SUMF1/EgtB/PvdO family nonheme iron enzyme [Phycisphaerales bacterium]